MESGDSMARSRIAGPKAALHRVVPSATYGISGATSIYLPPYSKWKTTPLNGISTAQYATAPTTKSNVIRRTSGPELEIPFSRQTRAAYGKKRIESAV